jgi:hypothetical protein
VTAEPRWVRPAARALLPWPIEWSAGLTGSDSSASVVRVGAGGRTAILKRYGRAEFEQARLVSGIPGAPFPAVLGAAAQWSVLAFADAGEPFVNRSDVADRAAAYVDLIDAALAAVPDLGPPPPCPPSAVTEILGFVALSPGARRLTRPSQQLAAIARATRAVRPPRELLREAEAADARIVDRIGEQTSRRRWILVDTNPSNVVSDAAGTLRLVDVALTPGLPDTDYLSLFGSTFREPADRVLTLLAGSRFAAAEPALVRLLNGLYSIFTHSDTCVGLAAGQRDGLVHSGLDLAASDAFSLGLARDLLAGPGSPAGGYLPLLDWLIKTEVRG